MIVLRSDGKLYLVGDIDKIVIESNKVKTGLGPKNNTEGLAYDASTHSLLIACKGLAHDDSTYANKRAIYRYSITDSLLSDEPTIDCLYKIFQ